MSETTRAAIAGRPAAPVRARLSVRLRRDWFLYALLALPIGYFLLFHYGPMYGVVVAFRTTISSRAFSNRTPGSAWSTSAPCSG